MLTSAADVLRYFRLHDKRQPPSGEVRLRSFGISYNTTVHGATVATTQHEVEAKAKITSAIAHKKLQSK